MNKDPKLTEKEQVIIRLISRYGITYKEAGKRMNLRELTMKNYVWIIMQKVGVKNSTQLVLWALKTHLVELHEIEI